LNELVTKVVGNKRYKKESTLDGAQMMTDVMARWPTSMAPNGQPTKDGCHFILSVKATAPTKVHVSYSQM